MLVYCYQLDTPIDFWIGAMTEDELFAAAERAFPDENAPHRVARKIRALERLARDGFRGLGWEGDVREGPYYFGLPTEHELTFGYALKQDNNGTTFVAAPFPLPWLENLGCSLEVKPRTARSPM